MTEINVWIGDLYEYNAGKLIGEWFKLPMDLSEILDEVLTHCDHEFYIADIDSSIKNLDGLSFDKLNELAKMFEDLSEYEIEELIMVLNGSDSIEEGLEAFENERYHIYDNCSNMTDVARQWYEETGMLLQIHEAIESYVKSQYQLSNVASNWLFEKMMELPKFYIDYEAMAIDLEIERNFKRVGRDTFIEIFD